jgi:hypothetical protein
MFDVVEDLRDLEACGERSCLREVVVTDRYQLEPIEPSECG